MVNKSDAFPMPYFTVNLDDIMIKFTDPEDKSVRVTDRVNDKVNDRLSEKELELLIYLYRNPGYTVTRLSKLMGVSRKTVAGYTKKPKEKNIIERIGSYRKGYLKILE